jgi:glycosyltransferase involved in cell wall biosynthesis
MNGGADEMKILYDYQIFCYQQFGGISRYFSKLLRSFHLEQMVDIQLPLRWSVNAEIDGLLPLLGKVKRTLPLSERLPLPGASKIQALCYSLFPSQNRELVQQQLLLRELQNKSCELFHPTYYEDYYIAHIGNMPFVITVFDMIHELFPEQLPGEDVSGISRKKKNVIQKATKIIAISESTKKDLCRLYGINPEKIVVVPLANSIDCAPPSSDFLPAVSLPEQYLLYIGTRNGYKNYRFFFSSIVEIFKKYPDLSLVCTGPPFSKEERELHAASGLEKRIVHVEAHTDTKFSVVYKNALMLVFPSLYEGFGLPILEAMHCGCPVIVSNTSSLPEVAGDAAVYIDPRSADSMRSSMLQVLESGALRDELREKGREQEKKFSWEKVTEQTLEVYRTAL